MIKKLLLTAALLASCLCLTSRADTAPAAATNAVAAVTTTNSPKPSYDDRLADLEAYVTNGARQTNAATALASSSGPGHNAWQMTSTALVLFMTLPGLALFYGGLVRRKNVLSVLAQCLGITGLVTIIWVVCGYSITFHSGKSW